jgi:glycosyltransferase involved in cell wall biosynthesis
MNHLLIDATFLINELKRKRPPHGIPRVILAYLRHFQDGIQLVYRVRQKIFILPKSHSQRIIQLVLLWRSDLYKNILFLIVKGILSTNNTYNPNDQWFLLKIDQNGMKYSKYFTQLHKTNIKILIMFHDLFPIIYPEYSDPSYAEQFAKNVQLSIKYASGIICVSINTQETVSKYINSNRLISPPTIAASLAPGFLPNASQEGRPFKEKYFVILSTIVARKNHLLLLHIWRKLVDQLGSKAPKLVIIGKRSSECSSTISMLDRCQQLRQHIVEIIATDLELQNYLTHATALLFPTYAEGYGLPLIEALAMNVPVLASDLPIFREIAADIPEFLEPIDGKGWMQMILEYAQEGSLRRAAQLQRIAQFKIPTWEQHFNKINAFIKQLST